MKILLTGANGMVGRNLLLALQTKKDVVVFSPSRSELDLLNKVAVMQYIKEVSPDLVIHLAAKVGGIQANMNDPVAFLAENLSIGLNVVLAALENRVPQLLNVASSCMYQEDDKRLLQEGNISTHRLEPTNEGYALAKISIMRLCQYVCRQYHLNYKTIIPCNLYGPYDNFDLLSGHMIPAAIHKLHVAKLNNQPEVIIWGDGTARREFMYVGDLVRFILLAIDKLDQMPLEMNLGLGADYSVNEYYQFVKDVVGYDGKFVHDLTKPVGMKRKLLDVSIAKQFGWQASTSIHEGVKETYQHFLNVFNVNYPTSTVIEATL